MSEHAPTWTLPLFAAPSGQPAWLIFPASTLERRFAGFHSANPAVYDEIERRALSLARSGRTRIGIAELVEDLRYDLKLRTEGEKFKLNNSYRAFYARLLIHLNPPLAGVVETRKQTHREGAA